MSKIKSRYPVKPTIVIDTREKIANALFQECDQGDKDVSAYIRQKVDAGDYIIAEFPTLVVIEKKTDGKELYGNFILKRDVFMKSIERMKAFTHKYIIIQQTYDEFLDPKNWKHISRGYPRRFGAMAAVESWLIALSQNEGIHFIWAGQKNAPRIARKILCKSYEYERKRRIHADKDREE